MYGLVKVNENSKPTKLVNFVKHKIERKRFNYYLKASLLLPCTYTFSDYA